MRFILTYFLIHGGGIRLIGMLVYPGDLHLQRALAESDLYNIAHLHLIAGLNLTSVDADTLTVAGFVGHCAALYEAGNLKIFVDSHINHLSIC